MSPIHARIAQSIHDLAGEIMDKLTPSRELQLAIVKLEEATHWLASDEIRGEDEKKKLAREGGAND